MNDEERVVLVDTQGQVLQETGQVITMPKMEAHQKGIRHLAVSVFILDLHGRLLLQRRALSKYHSPGKWSNSCCTHPRGGETPLKAAQRRLFEEMGLAVAISEVFTFAYRSDVGGGLIENEFDHIFFGQSDQEPVLDPAEVSDYLWIAPSELESDIGLNRSNYTVWFQKLWPEVRKFLPL